MAAVKPPIGATAIRTQCCTKPDRGCPLIGPAKRVIGKRVTQRGSRRKRHASREPSTDRLVGPAIELPCYIAVMTAFPARPCIRSPVSQSCSVLKKRKQTRGVACGSRAVGIQHPG